MVHGHLNVIHICSICHYHNFDFEFFVNSLNNLLNSIECDEALGTSTQQHIVLYTCFLLVTIIFRCLHIYILLNFIYVCMVCAEWQNIYSLCLDIPQHVLHFHINYEQKGWGGNVGEMVEVDNVYENCILVECTVGLAH